MMPNIINLRQGNWIAITPLEREAALQSLADHLAQEERRSACNVQAVPMDECSRGAFSHDAMGNGTIKINRSLLESDQPYQAVETLCHEDRHAHQFYVTQHPELAENEEQLQDWQMSEAGAYIQPEETLTFSTYHFQPTELDANQYARDRTDELYQNVFQDQNQYPSYKIEKEQEIADAQESARFELGDHYEEEARQAVQTKYQEKIAIAELSDIYQRDPVPADKSHLSTETRMAAEKVDRELAEEEAAMDAKLAEFYNEGKDQKSAEDESINESAQQLKTPTADSAAREADEEQSQDNDYHAGYGI